MFLNIVFNSFLFIWLGNLFNLYIILNIFFPLFSSMCVGHRGRFACMSLKLGLTYFKSFFNFYHLFFFSVIINLVFTFFRSFSFISSPSSINPFSSTFSFTQLFGILSKLFVQKVYKNSFPLDVSFIFFSFNHFSFLSCLFFYFLSDPFWICHLYIFINFYKIYFLWFVSLVLFFFLTTSLIVFYFSFIRLFIKLSQLGIWSLFQTYSHFISVLLIFSYMFTCFLFIS